MRNLLFASAIVSSVLFINGCDGECCQDVLLTQSIAVRGNQTPIPVITGLPTKSPCGTELTALATNSYDPDGTITSYIWKLDGTTLNGTESTSVLLPCDGKSHKVCLTVVDNEGAQQTTCQTLNIDNEKTEPPANNCDLKPKIIYEKADEMQYKFYCTESTYNGSKIDAETAATCQWSATKTFKDDSTDHHGLIGPAKWVNVDPDIFKSLDLTLTVKKDDCEATITEHYLIPQDLPY
jgi:hypothetical protein